MILSLNVLSEVGLAPYPAGNSVHETCMFQRIPCMKGRTMHVSCMEGRTMHAPCMEGGGSCMYHAWKGEPCTLHAWNGRPVHVSCMDHA